MAYSECSKDGSYHSYQLAIITYKAMCPALSKYQFSGYGITTENKQTISIKGK